MWKSHFSVDAKGIDFHRGCENLCGKLYRPVGIIPSNKVFHISTGILFIGPVEMWKTRS